MFTHTLETTKQVKRLQSILIEWETNFENTAHCVSFTVTIMKFHENK